MRRIILLLALSSFAFAPVPRPRPGPPDISGSWTSDDWGTVELSKEKGGYEGTYTGAVGLFPGNIRLEWSPKLRRFTGTWRGKNEVGTLSVTPQPGEKAAKGTYSNDPNCQIEVGCPKQVDLEWSRPAK